MFNIILIEENTILRTGIKALIDDHPKLHLFAEPVSVQEALAITPLGTIDLIITDISSDHTEIMNDIEALRSSFPDASVLAFTAPDNKAGALLSLDAGADTYLFKDVHGEELVYALEQLIEKKTIKKVSVV